MYNASFSNRKSIFSSQVASVLLTSQIFAPDLSVVPAHMSKSMNPLRILENIPEGVFAINRDCRITYFNQRAEEITGYSREQALGKTCYEVFRPEICQTTCSIKQSMATGKESFDQQVNVLNRSNRPLSIRIQTSPLRDEGGCIVGGLQTFHVIDRPDEEIRQELTLFELRKKMGRDRRLARIFEVLPDLARSDAPVLLQGEPGTGKKLLARAIHQLSGRASGPFFHVSCRRKSQEQLTEELLGSSLLLEKDQESRERGILERAHRGTVFLDGIEVLPYPLQVSIFRAMEEGAYMPVGGTTPLPSDIRLIASSESDLEEKVKEGTFRENLFYCLNVFKIQAPPLRDRKDDIPLLSRDIIWHLSLEEGKDVHEIDDASIRILQAYAFPANLRELRVILERACRTSRRKTLKPEDLRSAMTGLQADPDGSSAPQRQGAGDVQNQERAAILAALLRNQWNRKRTAHELGIDRTTLWRKLKRMGIQPAGPDTGKQRNP
jgi:PAS domain S-box-containing protein